MERAYRHTEVSVDGFSAASPRTEKVNKWISFFLWDFGGEKKKKKSQVQIKVIQIFNAASCCSPSVYQPLTSPMSCWLCEEDLREGLRS